MSRWLSVLLALALLACSGGKSASPNGSPAGGEKAAGKSERKVKYWRAPMDPNYIRFEPGKSPMGMDLVPVYEDEAGGGEGMVKIDPVVVQDIGVRTALVRRGPISHDVRTIGQVEVAEDELSVVDLRFGGWVDHLYVDTTGEAVRRGQVLFDIYSPDLVAAQEEYLLALRGGGPHSPLARSARRKLELWDIPASDIDAIAKAGKARDTLPIRAPDSGFVLEKHIVQGDAVKQGEDLYRIGNLDRIWVTAEVYESDAPWVKVGQTARMSLTYQAGEELTGEVAYVYPTLDHKSRTLRVRLEFPNPGLKLKPGMFATVRIQTQARPDALVVPTESIIHSGEEEIVFLALGKGHFAARDVTTGVVGEHHLTEIRSGLREGDVVVTSSQFLLDSASQLQEAAQKMLEPQRVEPPKHEKPAEPMKMDMGKRSSE